MNSKYLKPVCFVAVLSIFAVPSYSTTPPDLPSGALCNEDNLNTDTGPVDIEVTWEPNTINTTWYSEGTQVSGPASCTYNAAMTLPSTRPTREGYTFAGWRLNQCMNHYACGMTVNLVDIAPTNDATHIRWKPLNGSSGYTMTDVYGTENSDDLNNGEISVSFSHGTIKGIVTCNTSTPTNGWDTIQQGFVAGTMTNEQAIDILSSCYSGAIQPGNTFTSGATGQNCWFKMTSYTPLNESQCLIPSAPWMFVTGLLDGTEDCASNCAQFAT